MKKFCFGKVKKIIELQIFWHVYTLYWLILYYLHKSSNKRSSSYKEASILFCISNFYVLCICIMQNIIYHF